MGRYGSNIIYVIDSAGAMGPDDVKTRISAVKNAVVVLGGFHARNNLDLTFENTLAGIETSAVSYCMLIGRAKNFTLIQEIF